MDVGPLSGYVVPDSDSVSAAIADMSILDESIISDEKVSVSIAEHQNGPSSERDVDREEEAK